MNSSCSYEPYLHHSEPKDIRALIFQIAATGQDNTCGNITTKHGTTSTCTRTLNGTWRLNDIYTYGSTQYTICTASHTY